MGVVILMNNGAGGSTPPTADLRVRQAVIHALDTELIDQRVNGGAGLPTSAMIHPRSRFASPGVEGPGFDPELARSLVEEVKAEGSWDGRVLLTCGVDPASTERALAVEALLENVGFDVEVEGVTSTVQRVIVDQNYELACWGLGVRDDTPYVKLEQNMRGGSASNYMGYASEAFDDALDAMRVARTIEEQREALAAAQEVWNETAPTAVLEAVEVFIATAARVEGLRMSQNFLVSYADARVSS